MGLIKHWRKTRRGFSWARQFPQISEPSHQLRLNSSRAKKINLSANLSDVWGDDGESESEDCLKLAAAGLGNFPGEYGGKDREEAELENGVSCGWFDWCTAREVVVVVEGREKKDVSKRSSSKRLICNSLARAMRLGVRVIIGRIKNEYLSNSTKMGSEGVV